ncbi:bridge-like lipid transfer protein family member 1 isoform X2 [Antedon mediterranea]|uniref:bridge-like lipid transfer protein family member 1 isoform X2 n=1 Tax=Antedon mediterranea TaxID=105859 RepID=UPI003AF4C6C6
MFFQHLCNQTNECLILNMDRLVVEAHKAYFQTRLQVLLSPVSLHIAKHNQDVPQDIPDCSSNKNGFCLSGLQLRAHAMFSDEGLPPEVDTVEYAWLVELQLGLLSGQLSPTQALAVTSFAETFIMLVTDSENTLEQPIRDVKCVHQVIQTACRVKEKVYPVPCPTEGLLKYRMTRVWLEGFHICLKEEDSVLAIQTSSMQVSTCNLHSEAVEAGLSCHMDLVEVKLFMAQTETNKPLLQVGELKLGPVNLDSADLSTGLSNCKAQQSFLRLHDKRSRRLWFLWPPLSLNFHASCGCLGGCTFFGNGKSNKFLLHGKKYASNPSNKECLAYGQSLLRNEENVLQSNGSRGESPTKDFFFTQGFLSPGSTPCSPFSGLSTEPVVIEDDQSSCQSSEKTIRPETIGSDRTSIRSDGTDVQQSNIGLVGSSSSLPTTSMPLPKYQHTRHHSDFVMRKTMDVQKLESPSEVDETDMPLLENQTIWSQSSTSLSEYYSADEDAHSSSSLIRENGQQLVDQILAYEFDVSLSAEEGSKRNTVIHKPQQEVESNVSSGSFKSAASVTNTIAEDVNDQPNVIDLHEQASVMAAYTHHLSHVSYELLSPVAPGSSIDSALSAMRTPGPPQPTFNVIQHGFSAGFMQLRDSLSGEHSLSSSVSDIISELSVSTPTSTPLKSLVDELNSCNNVEDVTSETSATTTNQGNRVIIRVGGPLEVFLSPLMLPAMQKLVAVLLPIVSNLSPPLVLDHLHSSCLDQVEKTVDKSKEETDASNTQLTVNLKQVNVCLLQVGSWFKPGDVAVPVPVHSLLALCGYNFNVGLTTGSGLIGQLSAQKLHAQLRLLPVGSRKEDSGSGVTSIPDTHSKVMFFCKRDQDQREYGWIMAELGLENLNIKGGLPEKKVVKKEKIEVTPVPNRSSNSSTPDVTQDEQLSLVTVSFGGIWTGVPAPKKTVAVEDMDKLFLANLLNTATPALDAWLIPADHISSTWKGITTSFHTRKCAILVSLMTMAHENEEWKKRNEKSYPHLSKRSHTIQEDLSCQLLVLLLRYIQSSRIDLDDLLKPQVLPAATTLDKGVHVLLRQWRMNLSLVNPMAATRWQVLAMGPTNTDTMDTDPQFLDNLTNDGVLTEGDGTQEHYDEASSLAQSYQYTQMKGSQLDLYQEFAEPRPSKSANVWQSDSYAKVRSQTDGSTATDNSYHSTDPYNQRSRVLEERKAAASSPTSTSPLDSGMNHGDIELGSLNRPDQVTMRPKLKSKLAVTPTAPMIGEADTMFYPLLDNLGVPGEQQLGQPTTVLQNLGAVSVVLEVNSARVYVIDDKPRKATSRKKSRHSKAMNYQKMEGEILVLDCQKFRVDAMGKLTSKENNKNQQTTDEEKQNQEKLIDIQLAARLGKIQLLVNMPLLRFIVHLVSMVNNFKSTRTNLKLARYTSNAPVDTTEMLLRGESTELDETDDVFGSRYWEADSDTEPRCWQTMYHLIDLYSGMSDQMVRGHLTINPLFNIENEDVQTSEDDEVDSPMQTPKDEEEEEEELPGYYSMFVNHVILTTTAVIDNVYLQAKLGGLQLESEIIKLYGSVTHEREQRPQSGQLLMTNVQKVSSTAHFDLLNIHLLERSSRIRQVVLATSLNKSHMLLTDDDDHLIGTIMLGEFNMELPQNPATLHEMATRSSRRLTDQATELSRPLKNFRSEETLSQVHIDETDGAGMTIQKKPVKMNLILKGICMQAMLLPSLRAQYKLKDATGNMNMHEECHMTVHMPNHAISFISQVEAAEESLSSASIDLPTIEFLADMNRRQDTAEDVWQSGKFCLIASVNIGSFNHTISTDLLNHLVFVQKVFIKEVNEIMQKLVGDDNTASSQESLVIPKKTSLLPFTLTLKQQGIQVTAQTPSTSAVQFETNAIQFEVTNQLPPTTDSQNTENVDTNQIFLKTNIELTLSVGDMIRNPLFEEAQPEFTQLAFFKTNINIINTPESSGTSNNGVILVTLQRPVFFMPPQAVDKAVLVWLNYKNAYDHWHEQRQALSKEVWLATQQVMSRLPKPHIPVPAAPTAASTGVFLQVSVQNLGLCVPTTLIQRGNESHTSVSQEPESQQALVLTLDDSLISAHYCGALVSEGQFSNFCLRFADDFGMSLDDWKKQELEIANSCTVPKGSYKVCSKTFTSGHSAVGSAGKWELSFKWEMQGMDIKIYPNIGHHLSVFSNTVTALTGDPADSDIADLSTVMSEPEEQNENKQLSSDSDDVCPVNDSNVEHVEPLNLKVVFRKARDKRSQDGKDSKRRSKEIIDKMREQAKIVNDLRNLGAKSGTINEETKHLEKLEEAVFKEFRKDMRRKLRKGGGTKGNTWKDHLVPGLIPLPRGHVQGEPKLRRLRSKSVMSPTSYQRPNFFASPIELTPSRSHIPRVVFDLPTPDRESYLETSYPDTSYPQTEPRPQRLKRQSVVDDCLNVTIGDPRQVTSELLQQSSRYLWPLTRNRHVSETTSDSDDSSSDESVINVSHQPPPKKTTKSQRSNEEGSIGASPSHTVKPEQTVDMALDLVITTDSGWLEIFAKNPRLDETADDSTIVSRKTSLPVQPSISERQPLASYMSIPGLGQRHRSLTQTQQTISTMLFVPGIDAKVNYNSQLEAVENEDGNDKKPQKKASLYCKIMFQAAPKEIVLSPILLDFIEKTLEEVYQQAPKPSGSFDESVNSGVEIEPSNTSLVSSSTSGYSTFPVEVVVYLCIKPSTIRFSCLPISRVQCLLQLPSVELAFSSSRHVASIKEAEDMTAGPDVSSVGPQSRPQSELIKGGLNVSACLSDFSLFVFHPYGGQQRVDSAFVNLNERDMETGNRRDSLSVKVEFIRVNLSRKRRAYVLPTSSDVTDSTSPAVVTENLRSTSPAPSHLSRTSTSSGSPSSIKFSILCDIGSASLNYDIRRLTEVLAFPKAWYRKSIARQLFFGKESTTQLPTKQPSECDSSDSSSPKLGGSLENLSGARSFPLKPPSWRTPGAFNSASPGLFNLYSQLGRGTPLRQAFLHRSSDGTPAELIARRDQQRPTSTPLSNKDKESKQLVWDTRVVIGINLSKLQVNMNMSNVMGTSVWLVKGLQKQVWISLDNTGCKDVRIVLDLEQSSIDSHGGVIGGRLEMTKFHSTGHIMEQPGKEPKHTVAAKLDDLSVRVDYMGGSTLLCQLTEVDLNIKDEWRLNLSDPAQASSTTRPASIFVLIDFKWDTVQMMITRSTTPDLIKIINKLTEFISQQFHSSKMAFASLGSEILTKPIIPPQKATKATPPPQAVQNHHRHWQPVSSFLSDCANWVFGEMSIPELGTVLGGQVKLSGNSVLLACFGGINFRAKSWALFALREPTIHFDVESMKVQENTPESDTLTLQDLQFYLGHNQVQRNSNGTMASIYRITASERSNYPATGASIQQCFQYICSITMHEDLRPFLQAIPSVEENIRYKHEAVPIFCLPKLHLQMRSKHLQGRNIPTDEKPMVDVTFITQFDDHIHMAMDIELVIFLHDLVSSYIDKKDKDLSKTTPLAPDKKLADMTPSRGEEDWRVFQCTTWQLEPTVRLLSLGGKEIEALGADYILNKLGFKHARTTIPKWFQRGAMDPMNKILALLVHNLLQAMHREEKVQ